MKAVAKRNIKLFLFLILVSILNLACTEELTPPINEEVMEINFPIGKKAIYASESYIGERDSLNNYFLNIYSLQFDTIITKGENIEYIGVVEQYTNSFYFNDSSSPSMITEYYESGRILVSVDEKWVLFQNSELMSIGEIFLKRNSTNTDTTYLPNWLYSQFPILPKELAPNSFYSAYRPGYGNFIPVQRDITTYNYSEWSDIYGENFGLAYSTDYTIKFDNEIKLISHGIFDEKGVVISSSTLENRYSDSTEGTDLISVHFNNRRIVNFSNPEFTQDLSWYFDYVKKNGLTIFRDQ